MMNRVKIWTDKHIQGDPVIWLVVICLSVFGILVVYSATGSLAYRFADGNTEKVFNTSYIHGRALIICNVDSA